MMRLTGKRNSRISNRLAVFAALLLLVTSLASVGDSTFMSHDANSSLASESTHKSPPVKINSRGFKVSLFLFRSN
ncbi:hypothetical protein ACFL07_11050 [Pseudomonadota bacterium]